MTMYKRWQLLEEWLKKLGRPGSGNWGHAGRPGKRGGSAPTKGIGAAASLKTGPTARKRQEEAKLGPTERITISKDIQPTAGLKEGRHYHKFTQEDFGARSDLDKLALPYREEGLKTFRTPRFEDVALDRQAAFTDDMAATLAKKYGVEESVMQETLAGWTAGPNNPNSTVIMETVSEMFGAPMTAHQKAQIDQQRGAGTVTKPSDVEGRDITIHPLSRGDARKIVSGMYNETQSYFKERGVSHVRLQRGMGSEILPERLERGDITSLKLSPISSWTTSAEIAGVFQDMFWPGATVAANVPVERILSFPRTGIGSLSEGEFLVIGGGRGSAEIKSIDR